MRESCVDRNTWFYYKRLYVQCHCNVNTWILQHSWQFPFAHCASMWRLLTTALGIRYRSSTISCACAWPDNHFTFWWIGRGGQTEWSVSMLFVFEGSGQTESVQITTNVTKWTGTADSRYFCCCSSSLLTDKCWYRALQVAEVCEKCQGLSWNTMLSGSVWAIEWCKICSNTTFRFGDRAALRT
jgi:hypothetical protein